MIEMNEVRSASETLARNFRPGSSHLTGQSTYRAMIVWLRRFGSLPAWNI